MNLMIFLAWMLASLWTYRWCARYVPARSDGEPLGEVERCIFILLSLLPPLAIGMALTYIWSGSENLLEDQGE